MMISYFRLLDGLTSLMWSLCLSHFWASDPEGILPSRFISFHQTRKHGHGNRGVTDKQDDRDDLGEAVDGLLVGFVFQPERLEHRARAVAEMNAKQADAENVEARRPAVRKSVDHHLVDI